MKRRMLKYLFSCLIIVFAMFIGVSKQCVASPVTFAFTADNCVLQWYLNGNLLTTPDYATASNWRLANIINLDLEVGKIYEVIWQVENVSSPGQSPGAFLAEITSSVPIQTTSLLSSTSWEVSVVWQSRNVISDFSSFTWVLSTDYGANSDTSTIWNQYNNGPISGISGDARWIWWDTNWQNLNSPAAFDSVFIKTTFTLTDVPEPTTMILLGLGMIGLVSLRRMAYC